MLKMHDIYIYISRDILNSKPACVDGHVMYMHKF